MGNSKNMFSGCIVALVTPMDTQGNIAWDDLKRLVEYHLAKGMRGIVSMGTTGECATLSHKEHIEVVEYTKGVVGDRAKVIAGTGSNSTEETIALTRDAQAIGVDGCLIVAPYYNNPTQKGLIAHYKKVASTVDVPIILYNVPSRTVVDISPETVKELSRVDNIVAIKEAYPDAGRVTVHKDNCDPSFVILSGNDQDNIKQLQNGAEGAISVTANVASSMMTECMDAWANGQYEKAQKIDSKLQVLHSMLFVESSPAPTKWLLQKMGVITEGGIRLPLVSLSEEHHEQLLNAALNLGLVE